VPEPVPLSSPDDRWAGLRAVFAPKRTPDEGELDKLRGAISEAASLLRTYTFGYLTVALYLVVTTTSTTHEQLLIGKEINLPVVDVGVSLVGFYVLAPVVFMALHSNLLFHLEALALLGHFLGQRRTEVGATMGAAGDGTPEPLKQEASNCRQRGLWRWPCQGWAAFFPARRLAQAAGAAGRRRRSWS
jgi:hypothetical protein